MKIILGGSPRDAWEAVSMLARLRDRDGGPDWRVRMLAVVLVLLLAGPLTVLVVRAAGHLLDLAL